MVNIAMLRYVSKYGVSFMFFYVVQIEVFCKHAITYITEIDSLKDKIVILIFCLKCFEKTQERVQLNPR